MTTAFDPTPLTEDERAYFFAAANYGADHRTADGYAPVGSFLDAAAKMRAALAELATQTDADAKLWATAPGLPRAHCFGSYEAVCASIDGSILLSGANIYFSPDGGATWYPAGHHDAPQPDGELPPLLPEFLPPAPPSAPAAIPRRSWLRRLFGERDWSPRPDRGCTLAALLLVVCVPVGLLIAAYSVHLLAASPAAACLILPARRRVLAQWNCGCGYTNSEMVGTCAGCGRSRA